jgi:lipopolysaccharide transport system ATP-binding protein
MSDVLVKVDNVSKRFCRSLKRSLWYGLQDLGSEIGGRRHGGGSGLPQNSADVQLRPDEFWAVKDVSFELRRGECLGLIGRNGAGKTTLLRMLNGLIKPDTGRIEMKGQIGALIALGAGFNPILTGRENIQVNASILGLSAIQIKSAIDEIVDFAEIGDFIDSPVQSYSSGMQVRLGFGVASCIRPDILLVDEALAVGDIEFRSKCYNKIKEISESSAIILVSHNKQDLQRVCRSGLVLKGGEVKYRGGLLDGLSEYENLSNLEKKRIPDSSSSFASKGIQVKSASITPASINTGDSISIALQVSAETNVEQVFLRATFMSSSGECFAEYRSEYHMQAFSLFKEPLEIKATTPQLHLSAGSYLLNLVLYTKDIEYLALCDNIITLRVNSDRISLAPYII